MLNPLVSEYLIPVAVIVSATATTTSAVFLWRLFRGYQIHEQALFGVEEIEGHDGVVGAVNENTRMVDTHRRVLRRNDLIDEDNLFHREDGE